MSKYSRFLIISMADDDKDTQQEVAEIEIPDVVDKSVIRRMSSYIEHKLMFHFGLDEVHTKGYGD